MSPELVNPWIGIAFAVVPVLLVGWLILKKPVFWFMVVLIAVGLGYLHTTGAAEELGNMILTEVNNIYPTGIEPTGAAEPAAMESAPSQNEAPDTGSTSPVTTVPAQ